jgi:hypothetical protein
MVDLQTLLRLRGTVEAQTDVRGSGGQGLVESYPRIRSEVERAIGPDLHDEFSRLFPSELASAGRPWGAQADEVRTLLSQMAGWIGGLVESAMIDQRIEAEDRGR